MRRCLSCGLALAALASTEVAAAQPAPAARVILRKRACAAPSLDEASFSRLLGSELGTDGVVEVELVDAAAPLPAAALAVITLEGACESAVLTVIIDDAATDKQLRRAVDLRAVPEPSRAQTLSEATAQLLRASWAELPLPHAPRPRTPVPAEVRATTAERMASALPPAAAPASRAPEPVFLSAALDGRYLFGAGVGLLGVRLLASVPVIPHLRLRFDAGAAHGSATDLGLWAITGAVGVSFAQTWDVAAVEVGPRVELGWASSRGDDGYSAATLLATTSIVTAGRLRLGGHGWCSLELELGPVLRGFEARDGSTIGGAMGAVRLGLGAAL